MIALYSGLSMSKNANGGGVDQWNREHVWAKSHGDFDTATGPGTDLHHLRPEDVTVNSWEPPDAFEMRRNNVIYDTWQLNRNPFVDHPEWADAIW